MASACENASDLVDQVAPTAVVLDADLPDRQAWNACEQITQQHPGLTVVLSAAEQFDDPDLRPAFDSAAFVSRRDGLEALAHRIVSTSFVPAV